MHPSATPSSESECAFKDMMSTCIFFTSCSVSITAYRGLYFTLLQTGDAVLALCGHAWQVRRVHLYHRSRCSCDVRSHTSALDPSYCKFDCMPAWVHLTCHVPITASFTISRCFQEKPIPCPSGWNITSKCSDSLTQQLVVSNSLAFLCWTDACMCPCSCLTVIQTT
jgi:hypothetical protein